MVRFVVCKSTMHGIFLFYSLLLKRCHRITIFSLCTGNNTSAFLCEIFITLFSLCIHFSTFLIPFHSCYWIFVHLFADSLLKLYSRAEMWISLCKWKLPILKYVCQNKELDIILYVALTATHAHSCRFYCFCLCVRDAIYTYSEKHIFIHNDEEIMASNHRNCLSWKQREKNCAEAIVVKPHK